jgi:hypothetical protein
MGHKWTNSMLDIPPTVKIWASGQLPHNLEDAENQSRNLFDLFVTGRIIEWHLTCLSGPWTLTQLRSRLNRDSRGTKNNCLGIFPGKACTWPLEPAKIAGNMV